MQEWTIRVKDLSDRSKCGSHGLESVASGKTSGWQRKAGAGKLFPYYTLETTAQKYLA